MSVATEFTDFLKEYSIVALAVAFVMGAASTDLVKSLVTDVVMPILTPVLSVGGGSWQAAVWALGPVQLAVGPFLAALINFIVIALVVFLVVRKLFKMEAK